MNEQACFLFYSSVKKNIYLWFSLTVIYDQNQDSYLWTHCNHTHAFRHNIGD